ncbi:MAG TPA: fatty acid desaturase [Geminicoccaceae bacterium]|nr:fatty acid desaturase [Geminicoccaceae bacterium]
MASEPGRIAGALRGRATQVPWIEWPTVALAAGIYTLFLLLTWFHAALPWWLLLPLGTLTVALHASLQHEVIHGHPTRERWLNDGLGKPSLWLWLPYELYRESHLRHHNNDILTDPLDDPESYYVTAGGWQNGSPLVRRILVVNQTLAGRLTLGPVLAVLGFWRQEVRRALGGDRRHLIVWLEHAGWVALVLAWVVGVCGMPFWQYLLFFAFPGTALNMLRSYMEHRPAADPGARCAIVEDRSGAFGFLFLNNNLHAVHHRWPAVPWYRLPALYRARRDEILAWNGNFLIPGYRTMAKRFLISPKDHPIHPDYA